MNSMVASMALPPNLMNKNRKRTALCLLGATLCVFMAFGAALYFGRYPITLQALQAGGRYGSAHLYGTAPAPCRDGAGGRVRSWRGGLCVPDCFPQSTGKPGYHWGIVGGQRWRGICHLVCLFGHAGHHGMRLCGRAGSGVSLAWLGGRRRGAAR